MEIKSTRRSIQFGLLLILFLFTFLSMIWFFSNISTYIQRYRWITATATITFVGLPDGAVIGTYTDMNHDVHTDVPLYSDFFHRGMKADVDGLIGKKVAIVYNPLTGEVAKNTISFFWISFALFLMFLGMTILCMRKLIIMMKK